MSTPHILAERGDVAKTVLMPGDPLRAKFIAETYLTDAVCFNEVRGMLGYTGLYKGTRISVMGSGMGIPSMGIYSYELFDVFDVDNIIRIGTCGTSKTDIHIGDIVMAMGASTNSNFAHQYDLPGIISALADYGLLETAVAVARQQGHKFYVGNVSSGDAFYSPQKRGADWARMGVLAGEMESYALYLNAAYLGKKALGIFTVSDENYEGGKRASTEERQNGYTGMMEIALETALRIEK